MVGERQRWLGRHLSAASSDHLPLLSVLEGRGVSDGAKLGGQGLGATGQGSGPGPHS